MAWLCVSQVCEILLGSIGRYFSSINPLDPPRSEIEHIVARNLVDREVATDIDEILDGPDPGISPAPQLVLALSNNTVLGQRPVKLQRSLDCDSRLGNTAKQRRSLLRLASLRIDRFNTRKKFGSGECGHFLYRQVAIATALG